jgi:hypothetical protein
MTKRAPLSRTQSRTQTAQAENATRDTQTTPDAPQQSLDIGALQQTAADPASASPGNFLMLQRVVGNRAASRMLGHGAGSTRPTIQAKLTVGPTSDSYEQEADHVVQQNSDLQRKIQRKSDKLPKKSVLLKRAPSGHKFGATAYTKVLNAIDNYHSKVSGTDFMAQLRQLITISTLLFEWEVAHGTADTGEQSKNVKEAGRRSVMADVKKDYLPKEIQDVYQQAKHGGQNPDVMMLMQLMDALAEAPAQRGQIESDYATALRSFTANSQQSKKAKEIMGGKNAQFMTGSISMRQGGTLANKAQSLSTMDTDPSGGRMDTGIMDAPIDEDNDSETLQKIKRERAKLVALVPALQNMSDVEMMAIGAYTDEAGYGDMNALLRGGKVVTGKNKQARQRNLDKRKELQQANLMAISALNKLPDWSGRTIWRGEGADWAKGQLVKNNIITFPSFTSTTINQGVAQGYASAKGGTESTVWEFRGITSSGKDIAELSVQQKAELFSENTAAEAEVLLKPYTRVKILSVAAGTGYKNHVVVQQV